MPHTPFDFEFQKARTSANDGRVLANAQGVRYSNGLGVNRNLYPWYLKIRMIAYDTSSGGTVTFLIQDSPDDSVYTTRLSKVLTIPASLMIEFAPLFKTAQPYVRVRCSAFAGGTTPSANVYGKVGTY